MTKPANDYNYLDRKLREYYDFLQTSEKSPLTIRNYKHYLSRFFGWCKIHFKNNFSTPLPPKAINNYRKYLQSKNLAKNTVAYHLIALRSFLRWSNKVGYNLLDPDKIELPKFHHEVVEDLTGEQVDKLLSSPGLSTIQGKRDKAILELLFSTGIRVSELIAIEKNDTNLKTRTFVLRGGRVARVVPFSARAGEWIERYLAARKDKYSPLFIRHKGGKPDSDNDARLTARSVQRMVKKYVKKVGLPSFVTPHTLRHSLATNLLKTGADIRMVQKILNHKNIATTEQIYSELV